MSESTMKRAPVQARARHGGGTATVRWEVHMRAYEAYRAINGAQEALIDLDGRNCRGGFSTGELIAFLYAHSFPPAEWATRFDEAVRGMDIA